MKKKEIRAAFNTDMLVIARKSRGATQGDLADSLSMTSAYLSKIENNIKPFPEEKIVTLCEVLKYKEEFFYGTDRFLGIGPAFVYHRMRQSTSSKLLEKIEAQINVYRMNIGKLLRSVEIAPCRIPSYDLDDVTLNATPESIARTVRSSWYLPSGPARDLVKVIEDAGGIVIPYDFGTTKIDGASQHIPPLPPLFFINVNIPGDRWRFSLAHELGHMILHDTPRPDMEKEANRFAAEFLMPEVDISPYLGSLTFNKLLDLKMYWKCSMQSIVKRAKDIGAIPERTATYLFKQLSKAGYRTKEPGEFEREKPTLLSKLLGLHLNTMGYTVSNMCDLLGIYPDDFNALYASVSDQRHLRVAN